MRGDSAASHTCGALASPRRLPSRLAERQGTTMTVSAPRKLTLAAGVSTSASDCAQ